MKTTTTFLAVALFATAATAALAQVPGEERARRSGDRGQSERPAEAAPRAWIGRGAPAPRPAPEPQAASVAPQAPAASRVEGDRADGRRDRGPGEARPSRRPGGPPMTGDGQPARADGRDDRDRRDGNRAGDNRDRNNRDWDRGQAREGDRRDWDRRRADGRPTWERGRYPPVYQSQRRFRTGSYRAPYGYYSRSWSFGDVLPRGWYGDSYRITDFWAYDLPYPPPGYEWVRVGGDALLIDAYTGRVVQVVRFLFW